MNNKLTHSISLILVGVILAILFVGCTSDSSHSSDSVKIEKGETENIKQEEPKEQKEEQVVDDLDSSGLPIVETPIKMTFFMNAPDPRVANNVGDLEVMQEMMKRTNIYFEFIHPSAADSGEALNMMIASGDYPDLIRNNFNFYKGGIEGAIEDGIILDYTDLVDQYAVNYNKMITTEGLDKLVKSDTGKQIAFGSTFSCSQFIGKSFAGLIIREDWLNDLGLAMPETIDDWYVVLKAFKEEKNCPIPLGLCGIFSETSQVRSQPFVGSYGASYVFQLKDDVVKYGPILPEFKTFLETFSKWFEEGLINKDIATHDYSKDILPLMVDGKVGAITGHPTAFRNLYEMNDGKDPNFKLAPAPYPQVKKGEIVKYRHNHLGVNINPILVTTKCKYPVEAVKFIDYLYSPEGIDLETWGTTEGRTYTIEPDGTHKFTDLILNNPDGLTVGLARNKYTLDLLQGIWNWEWEKQQYVLPEQQNSTWGLWSSTATAENVIPELITMTAEENSIYTSVMSQVEPYAQEMILKFIMGIEPIEKFDEFVNQCKAMGIEKAEQAKQAAYERFKNRQ